MSSIIDQRNLQYDRFAEVPGSGDFLDRTADVEERVQFELIAEPTKVNRFTGHLTELRAVDAPGATDESVAGIDYIGRAREYASMVAEAVGFAAEEPVEFAADPTLTTTSSGMRVASLQQTRNGIDVWAMAPKVFLHEDGAVDRLVGDTVSLPADLPAEPTVPAEVALRVAAEEAAQARTVRGGFGADELPALDLSDPDFELLSSGSGNDRRMTFSKGVFWEDIPARLVYLDMGGEIRLTWAFLLSREDLVAQYRAFVEADELTPDVAAPGILYFADTVNHAITGRVFRHNPNEGDRVDLNFPLADADYPIERPNAGLPDEFPGPWTEVRNGKLSTEGNNVRALDGTTRRPFEVDALDGGGVFAPDQEKPEQFVTNIFFFCNYMHDFFMLLGFTEQAGNFQNINLTGQGKGKDAVQAFAHPRQIPGVATMGTRADGLQAVMNMGKINATGRHTAVDADVVFHEFVHGVTNRLVGGLGDADGLNADQSVSMGEGWSDYFALTLINVTRDQERVVTGNWVTKQPGGIRQRPYDENYPGKFGDIGKGPGQVGGNTDLSYQEVHDVGEIWCAALLQLTRNLSTALNSKERGYRVSWQAVVDGLKLTPKDPSFLTARDAVLLAIKAMTGQQLTNDEYADVRRAAWEAFAKFGMGFDASCPNASFFGCNGGSAMPPNQWQD